MDLSDQDIEEFREAWRRAFGELLSESQARYHASRLMEFLLMLARPLPGTTPKDNRQDTV